MSQDAPASSLGSLGLRMAEGKGLLFVDGRFAGDLEVEAPLLVTREAGTAQIRVTEAGRLDVVETVAFEAGVHRSLVVRMGLAAADWNPEPGPIRMLVGSPARGLLVPVEGSPAGRPVVYAIEEEFAPERLIVVLEGQATYEVRGPDGSEVSVTAFEGRLDGCPGRKLLQFSGTTPGTYTLTVRGQPGPFAFRYIQAPPPPAETDHPALKKRRAAPVPPRK